MRQHKTPCAECPFRRVAAAGWLGGFTADEFKWMAEAERRMPCHTRMKKFDGVDYNNPGTAPQCAGRAIYWANQCKLPRSPELLRLPRDPVAVFSWPHEFVAHHKNGLLAERCNGE